MRLLRGGGGERERERERDRDRQTDRQTDRETDRQGLRETHTQREYQFDVISV